MEQSNQGDISRIDPVMKNEQGSFFSSKMKMADLIFTNYQFLPVLERMGVPLGFGEDTVQTVCLRNGISTDFFLIICNVHANEGFVPEVDQIKGLDLNEVVDYLQKSHIYYRSIQIPKLKNKLEELVECYEDVHRKMIRKFFDGYQRELDNHFDYEEENVFPYIEQLTHGGATPAYSIEQFEENHSNLDEKLNDLKSIILKYLPDKGNSILKSEVLTEIFRLEEDIDRHTLIENKILVPIAAYLEKIIAWQKE